MNILVTGANRGLGLALTTAFLERGDTVVALCRRLSDATALRQLISSHNERLKIFEIDDLTLLDHTVLERVKRLVDRIDLLVNNAGVSAKQLDPNRLSTNSIGQFRRSDFLAMYDVNALSPLMLTQFLLPLIPNEEKSKVVFISSRDASFSVTRKDRSFAYAASKVALNMFVKFLSEYEKNKVTIVAMHPGWIQTDIGGSLAPDLPDDAAKTLIRTISHLNSSHSGKFINFDGALHPL